MANIDLYTIGIKDNASLKIDGVSKKLQSMTHSLLKQKMATQLSADALVRWEAKMAGAGPVQIMQIYQLQRQAQAHKEKQAAEARALEATVAAQKMEAEARSQQLQSTISAIDRAAAAQRKAQQADMQAQASVDRLVTSLRDEAATYGMTRDQIEIYRLEQSGATQAQIQSVKAAQLQRTETMRGIEASKGLSKHLRFMRGGFGQVGHQLQDIAVQAQMGTNAMIIFGQQGSQIASLFGPGGAMIGAVLAVGAALSTVLIPNLFGTSNAMKELTDKQKDLINKINQLDGVLKLEALRQANLALEYQNTIIKDASTNIAAYTQEQEKYNRFAESGAVSTQTNANTQKYLSDKIQDLNAIVALAVDRKIELQKSISGVSTASEKLLKDLIDENAQYGLNERQLAELEAANVNATGVIYDQIVAERLRNNELKATKAANEAATTAYDGIIVALAEEIYLHGKSASEIELYRARLQDLAPEQLEAIEALIKKRDAQNEATKSADESIATEKKRKDSLTELIEALDEESATMLLSARNLAIYNAGKLGAIPADIERISRIYDEIDAQLELQRVRDEAAETKKDPVEEFQKLREQIDADKETPAQKIAREYEERIAVIRAYEATENAIKEEANAAELAAEKIKSDAIKKLNDDVAKSQLAAASSVLSSFQTQISAMAEFVEEGSALGKAFYLAQQAMAAGMAIIKGYEAAMSIRAIMPIVGEPLAQASIAMGYVTAAMIAGQTLASFEGGGHVGGRSRSAGIDHKGGVLAMLHPNESVIDHTKGQSGGITVINNIDASGAGPEVDIKIEKAMNRSSAMTVAKIQDLMSRRRFA
jgi:hypothetical protein